MKFGVSQNKVIWRLLNLASPCGLSMQCTIEYMLAATNISENTQLAKFAKYNSTPKFVDLQYTASEVNLIKYIFQINTTLPNDTKILKVD